VEAEDEEKDGDEVGWRGEHDGVVDTFAHAPGAGVGVGERKRDV
jgi:hypothetical protein